MNQRGSRAARLILLLLGLILAGAAGGAAMWWLYVAPGTKPLEELAQPVPVDAVPIGRLTLSPLVERAAPPFRHAA